MRVHIVTPKAPVHVTIDPKVRPAPNPCPVFVTANQKPIALSQSAYWVLRLPYPLNIFVKIWWGKRAHLLFSMLRCLWRPFKIISNRIGQKKNEVWRTSWRTLLWMLKIEGCIFLFLMRTSGGMLYLCCFVLKNSVCLPLI